MKHTNKSVLAEKVKIHAVAIGASLERREFGLAMLAEALRSGNREEVALKFAFEVMA
jgi:hypothetical protein